MVLIFGVDVPLVEMIFVLTLVLILLFGLMIYLLVNQRRLNEMLNGVIAKENAELKDLEEIDKEEKEELKFLRNMRLKLDKMVENDTYIKKIEAMFKKTAGKKKGKVKKLTEKDKIKIIADFFWDEIFRISSKSPKDELAKQFNVNKKLMGEILKKRRRS